MAHMFTRRGFLGMFTAAALAALTDTPSAVDVADLPDDLSGTTTTHRIAADDYFGYYVAQRIDIGCNRGTITATRPGEIDVRWSGATA